MNDQTTGNAAGEVANNTAAKGAIYPFELPALPYAFDALEPFVDAETMQLHHDKHHQTYVDNLNKALENLPQFHDRTIEDILRNFKDVPPDAQTAIRNHGGGHANHQLFWKILKRNDGKTPTGELLKAIEASFGTFEDFKAKFNDAGAKLFGSGWVFLIAEPEKGNKLEIVTRPNQDSVLLDHKPALLGNDVWEHAYYLKYRNKRADYLQAWWNVVNWEVIADRLDGIRAGRAQL